ncbi:MAG TPA: M24 family metallopeptidase [Ignavibacteriales bacterium]|nr:M24 family metallopeptidase [Ignavibacteriales bacterium]HOL81358.1 M24 family metallopeptidase [Ignavibacteriales bacterium]HOM65474.1 M24 family metallopeptidase [Ignavibacteriales bacterium]HPP33873.1 M24 family metallopeptidase [Ignavibacteriales bacterium]HRR18496.1 M24 family metallopeptidase [Ignavibacteriales bacterium]
MQITKEKIQQAINILNEKNIDAWMIFTRESSNVKDPSLDIVVGSGCTWHSAFIITKNGDTIAILGSLDVANVKQKGLYNEVIGYVKNIKDDLLNVLNRLKPQKIALNFSRNSSIADGLTYGMYLELMDILKGSGFENKIISSEEIISALRGRKTQTEISKMKFAIAETLKIFDEVTKFIKVGITEKEVNQFVLNLVRQKGYETAWDENQCPAVFTGPDNAGAHADPTDRKIDHGHILNLDFGLKIDGYCSDLQRTWYILKPDEINPPEEVLKGFNTIIEAVELAAKALKPGVLGWKIDKIAREHIVNNGYEEYPHALGHQIGKVAHDGGGLLAPKWERYGNLPFIPVEKDQVYTIEPRLTVPNYGVATVEDMVQVTDDGCIFISEPQKEIYLVRC